MIHKQIRAVFAGFALFSVSALAQTGPLPAPTTLQKSIPDSVAQAAIGTGNLLAFIQAGVNLGTFVPFWEYEVQAVQNGTTYSGFILGSSPNYPWSSTISTPIVPVVLNINFGGGIVWTWDPTQQDIGCLGAGNNAQNRFWESPLLTPTNFTINGQFIGNTQYSDAILRSEFWNYPGFLGQYERRLTLAPALYPPLVINVTAGSNADGWYYTAGNQCGGAAPVAPLANATNPGSSYGGINVNYLDPLLQQYIATHGINTNQFPFFLLYKTMIFNGDATVAGNCCIGGYHNIILPSDQTYGIADFEVNAAFSGFAMDTSAASHEINEWINDPTGINPTPPWGNIGQVAGCQDNFEIADPLTGTFMPAIQQAGFTYHLQEIAFFNWFYGGTTNYGVGGKYSSNGTFTGYNKLCPPGGTN